jgi:hypothetical protein
MGPWGEVDRSWKLELSFLHSRWGQWASRKVLEFGWLKRRTGGILTEGSDSRFLIGLRLKCSNAEDFKGPGLALKTSVCQILATEKPQKVQTWPDPAPRPGGFVQATETTWGSLINGQTIETPPDVRLQSRPRCAVYDMITHALGLV